MNNNWNTINFMKDVKDILNTAVKLKSNMSKNSKYVFYFALISFFASYYFNPLLSILTLVFSISLLFIDRNIYIGLFIGISAFASFFELDIVIINDTLNRIMTVIYILYNIPKIRFIRNKNVGILIATYILILVAIISLIQQQKLLQISWVLNITLLIVVYYNVDKNYNYKIINSTILVLSLTWIVLIAIYITINPYIANIYTQRVTISEFVNENRMGMATAIYGVILLFNLTTEDKLLKKTFYGSVYLLSIYVIILTGSRNSLLSFFLCSLIILLYTFKGRNKMKKIIISMILLNVMVIFMYFIFKDTAIIARFSLSHFLESIKSNRLYSYPAILFNIIPNNIIFGVGFGGQEAALFRQGFLYYPPAHNLLISSLAEMGLFGFLPFAFIVIKALRNVWREQKKNDNYGFLKYSLLVVLLLGIGETIYTERILWILLSISLCIRPYKPKENKDVNINRESLFI